MAGDSDNKRINTVANQTSGPGIVDADDAPQRPQTFDAAVNYLSQTAASLLQQITTIETLFPGGEHLFAEAPSIRLVNHLANDNQLVSEALNGLAIGIILTRITSLNSSKTPETQGLLNHFDSSIQGIIRKFVAQPCDADTVWKVIEECCIQAVPSGQLDPNEFLTTREGVSEETKNDVRDEWARFWARTMNSCPDGPILFIPPKPTPPPMRPLACDWSGALNPRQNTPKPPPGDLPRFLFRAHDMDQTLNNEDTIASWGYHAHGSQHAKRDIFSLSKGVAGKMLCQHLNGDKAATSADNLVSWSSSLLYAIKNANCRSSGQSPHRVFICMLDTTKFPKSQFIRAKWLRNIYDGVYLDFRDMVRVLAREDMPEYDNNGEYLSQGKLSITGRSSTIPLPMLHGSGFDSGALYRELDISIIKHPRSHPENGRTRCVERLTVELRQDFKVQCTTTTEEIRTAMRIARVVLESFDELNFALMLLAFRERKINGEVEEGPSVCREPVEVVRYMALRARLARLREARPLNNVECLEELFALTPTDAHESCSGYER